jgi:adenine-specific DNA-methyltransferase
MTSRKKVERGLPTGQDEPLSLLLSEVEAERECLSKSVTHDRKAELGQFLTPRSTAEYMAGLFTNLRGLDVRLLDPGAGTGMLACAFLQQALADRAASAEISCVEMDAVVLPKLNRNVHRADAAYLSTGIPLKINIDANDFLTVAANMVKGSVTPYTHVILNPPYRKISSQSQARKTLHAAGIESVNLYGAFLALSIQLLQRGGEIVAIVPRSFCNGRYYFPLRKLLRETVSIDHVHVFDSRRNVFREDDVLQENVIIHLSKRAQGSHVLISSSQDATFGDYEENRVDFDEVVGDDDEDYFIHVPTKYTAASRHFPSEIDHCLDELDIQVSTGPVVDFRAREYIVSASLTAGIPLLYPVNMVDGRIIWPTARGKGSSSMWFVPETEKMSFPTGYYVVVRRFSSKEETRRIVAAVVSPEEISGQHYAFENHLNVFHFRKHGLKRDVAYGLMAYLNSGQTDKYFRRFSGHTQVNAGDLRKLRYPSLRALERAGRKAAKPTELAPNDNR